MDELLLDRLRSWRLGSRLLSLEGRALGETTGADLRWTSSANDGGFGSIVSVSSSSSPNRVRSGFAA